MRFSVFPSFELVLVRVRKTIEKGKIQQRKCTGNYDSAKLIELLIGATHLNRPTDTERLGPQKKKKVNSFSFFRCFGTLTADQNLTHSNYCPAIQ